MNYIGVETVCKYKQTLDKFPLQLNLKIEEVKPMQS